MAKPPKAITKALPEHLKCSCTSVHDGKKISFSEQGRSVIIVSTNWVAKTRADNCLYKNIRACDFVATDVGKKNVFIELKGTDVEHGVSQLNATITDWKARNLLEPIVGGLIVCRRYPRIDTKLQKLKSQFAKQHQAALHIISRTGLEIAFDRAVAFDGPF